jgi:hypothetical protein
MKSDTTVDFFSTVNTTKDTLALYLKTFFKDSATVYIQTNDIRIDTVELLPFKAQQAGRSKKVVNPVLSININNKDNLYAPTLLNFSYPIKPVDSAQMSVIAAIKGEKDTTVVYITIPDTLVTQVPIPFAFEPKINYTIWLKDSTFYGYDGATHDTLVTSLSKKTEKDYGNLILNYKIKDKKETGYIIELLSSNQKLIRKDIIFFSKTVEYKHLLPGSYHISVTEDVNKNGKWDTGNYRKKIQPEKIYIIDKELIVRGYWDIEEDIELR